MLKHVALCVLTATLAHANGIFIPRPPPQPGPPERPVALPVAVRDVRLSVDIRDQAARTQVEQVFENPGAQPLEGEFVLPLPPDAHISDFSFFIDGREVQGEILPSDKARQYYRDIVARLVDPALLEYMGSGMIRVKMFPIPARGEAKIRFGYTQILPSTAGQLTYYYPFGTNKHSSRPLAQAVVDVRIRSTVPLRAIYAPRHEVDVARQGEYEARVGFERRHFTPREDFLLHVGRSEEDFGVTALAYRSGDEDGYLLLAVSPKTEFGPSEVQPKDIVFVLDKSGSMAMDGKLDQAKEALQFCVRALGAGDRFNLVVFSTTAEAFKPGLAAADDASRREAIAFIEGLRAMGGTNIGEALDMALRQRAAGAGDRPFMVVFLTDGQPTIGETDAARLVARVAAGRPEGLRLFVFGVGDDVHTLLLDRLAEEQHGTRHYVRPGENLEARLSAFYQEIARPVLSGVTLAFTGGGVGEIYPPRITDIFHGRQVILVGRYREPGKHVFEIRGACAGVSYSYRYPVDLPAQSGDASYLPRLWATRKIGYLLDQIRLHGGDRELVDEVKELARRFGIVTPYTSYLVVEEGAVAAGPRGVRPDGGRALDRRTLEAGGAGRGGVDGAAPLAGPAGGFGGSPAAGRQAVDRSVELRRLKDAATGAPSPDAAGPAREGALRHVGSRTFYLRDGVWVDSAYRDAMAAVEIRCFSDAYFELLARMPDLAPCLALGARVLVVVDGTAYRITGEG